MKDIEKTARSDHRLAITTSWDDGHPLDLRIADLLAKYSLKGTFYVPLHNSLPTMSPAQIREISSSFEIGAHTVNHRRLTELNDNQAKREIEDSKRLLEDIIGKPCSIFCFPGGRYKSVSLGLLRRAGFSHARTVQLLSLQRPRTNGGISLIPTTIQAYPHRMVAYWRNALKQPSLGALRNLLRGRRAQSWPEFADALLERAAHVSGVFHLWGHSWEIEDIRQWQALERTLAVMSQYKDRASIVTNMELCN